MLSVQEFHENNVTIPAINKAGIVQSTINYKMFKIDQRNRPIRPRHLMQLHDRIERKNLLREYPIVVDAEMRVVDGQHRLKAAEALQVPIYYIVSDRATIADVADTNAITEHWKAEDYLHHYCSVGNLEYLKLQRFREKYAFLPLSAALRLCYYISESHGKGIPGRFRDGEYRANDVAFAVKVADVCQDFSRFTSLANNQTFIAAVANLVADSEYDHARMMTKMEYLSVKLVKCASVRFYMVVFNDIYNYKVRSDNEVTIKMRSRADKRFRADRKPVVAAKSAKN